MSAFDGLIASASSAIEGAQADLVTAAGVLILLAGLVMGFLVLRSVLIGNEKETGPLNNEKGDDD